jgi:hypothetical protein
MGRILERLPTPTTPENPRSAAQAIQVCGEATECRREPVGLRVAQGAVAVIPIPFDRRSA